MCHLCVFLKGNITEIQYDMLSGHWIPSTEVEVINTWHTPWHVSLHRIQSFYVGALWERHRQVQDGSFCWSEHWKWSLVTGINGHQSKVKCHACRCGPVLVSLPEIVLLWVKPCSLVSSKLHILWTSYVHAKNVLRSMYMQQAQTWRHTYLRSRLNFWDTQYLTTRPKTHCSQRSSLPTRAQVSLSCRPAEWWWSCSRFLQGKKGKQEVRKERAKERQWGAGSGEGKKLPQSCQWPTDIPQVGLAQQGGDSLQPANVILRHCLKCRVESRPALQCSDVLCYAVVGRAILIAVGTFFRRRKPPTISS